MPFSALSGRRAASLSEFRKDHLAGSRRKDGMHSFAHEDLKLRPALQLPEARQQTAHPVRSEF
jgi:hypothetical protein